MRSALTERAAFQAIHLTGKVPRQDDPKRVRQPANVTAMAD